jgi:hypothetical protein
MGHCLSGKAKIPDREEKTHNWNIYTELMLSTWIRIFTNEHEGANNAAKKWSRVIHASFAKGYYDHNEYIHNYESVFGVKVNPKAGRLVDFVHFYPISLLTNSLDEEIEGAYFQYILDRDGGMYYVYGNRLRLVPDTFRSKNTGAYLRAVELLSKYKNPECKKQLRFVVKWLKENMVGKNEWDMGKESKDRINFPLSDSWKADRDRIGDCTYRISRLIHNIESGR